MNPVPSNASKPGRNPVVLRSPVRYRGLSRWLFANLPVLCTAGLAVAPATPSLAASETPSAEAYESRNRLQIGGRLGFRIRADFSAANRVAPIPAGPEAGGAVDRVYADGAVRRDASGNADGTTWNWEYFHSSQVTPDGSGLAMHATTENPLRDSNDRTDDPHPGFELNYARMLGEWAGATWGVELGLNWVDVQLNDDAALQANLYQVTDLYPLDGTIPPEAPYTGSLDGPGPLLGSTPTRTLDSATARGLGQRQIEGDLLGFKLGPVLDIPLGDWLSAQFSGGLAVARFDGEFSYSETVTVGNGAAQSFQDAVSAEEWLVGGYVRGQISCRVTERIGVYAAAEFMGLESLDMEASTRSAHLDLSGGIYLTAGLSLRF